MDAKNPAEALVEEYLNERRITWQYEQEAGGRYPDFWLDLPSKPVCEVRHVTKSLSDLPGKGGAFDGHKPLANAIHAKAKQGKALDGLQPYVVMLWVPDWVSDPLIVSGAMFGRIQVVMPFDPATGTADVDQAYTGFGRDATLHGEQHRHISAVTIIHRFNPTLRAVQDEYQSLATEASKDTEADRLAGVQSLFEVFRRRTEDGTFDEDARQVRLVTMHNIHASTPLPLDVFNGSFDEQYSIGTDGYELVYQGEAVPLLPE